MAENAIETIRLLIVSREPGVLRPLWSIGETNSWQLETAGSGWEALERLQSGAAPHVLLLDVPRGDADALHVVRWLRRLRPDLPIIVLSYPNGASQEKEAIRLGAQDYLVRPFDEAKLENTIRRLLDNSHEVEWAETNSEEIEQLEDGAFFIGMSPAMQKLRAQAKLLAEADVPVLIFGESGSGKDTVARLVHKLSVRSGCKFLRVNCAALPGELLEVELFGSEGKSSPGTPTRPRLGKFDVCGKGTILLEDVAAMPDNLQAKLLQLLQEKTFIRPGGKHSVAVDVRVLATCGNQLERALAERKLREDLYYRLSTFTLSVPPLRQRKEEIAVLVQHFMHRLAKQYGITSRTFSPAVIDACRDYTWPGNMKELEEFVKRYLLMGDPELSFRNDSELEEEAEEPALTITKINGSASASAVSGLNGSGPSSLKSLVQNVKLEAERNAISAALEKTGWNRKAAARLLKVSYRTILYKIEQYRMKSPEAYSTPLAGNGFNGNGGTLKHNEKHR
ncbi:MAG TPA: sigma-54 dependent transcriptional regulator [Terriglobales bacterium]|nr:sigma-54 dependent transcriptional regulator [Terriglobales bacterium]